MGWLRRLGSTVVGKRLERMLDEEMRFHVDERTDEYVRAGMTPREARRSALIKFGSIDAAKEAVARATAC